MKSGSRRCLFSAWVIQEPIRVEIQCRHEGGWAALYEAIVHPYTKHKGEISYTSKTSVCVPSFVSVCVCVSLFLPLRSLSTPNQKKK